MTVYIVLQKGITFIAKEDLCRDCCLNTTVCTQARIILYEGDTFILVCVFFYEVQCVDYIGKVRRNSV